MIYAEIAGDEAAAKRFKLSTRSLYRYRDLAQDESSELAKTVKMYAAVLHPETEAAEFGDFLTEQVRRITNLFAEKGRDVDARNPEGLRALTEHVTALLDHKAALEYIDRAFAPEQPEEDE